MKSLLSSAALIAAFALCSCGLFDPPPPLSPGEIPYEQPALERRRGEGNACRQVVAAVANSEGEFLLSLCIRQAGSEVNLLSPPPMGGKRIFGQASYDWLDEMIDQRWKTMYNVIVGQCFQRLTLPEGRGYGLNWTLQADARQGDESAWENAVRAVREQGGIPSADRLEQEFFYFDEETATGFFRFRYTGHPGDEFILADPARVRGKAYCSISQWVAAQEPPLQLLIAHQAYVEQMDVNLLSKLFGIKAKSL
jgi:hypothetical protein